jgi:signal peptidase I
MIEGESIDKIHLIPQDSIASAVFDIWQEVGKESRLKVSGWSMSPLIKNGDLVIIRHAKDSVGVGSIIAYRKAQQIITHRVIQVHKEYDKTTFITKGDFNLHSDTPVSEEEVIGKVIAVEKGKRIFYLDTKVWRVVGYILAYYSSIVGSTYRRMRSLKMKLYKMQDTR